MNARFRHGPGGLLQSQIRPRQRPRARRPVPASWRLLRGSPSMCRFIHNNRHRVPPSCVRYSVPILRSILSGGFGFRGHSQFVRTSQPLTSPAGVLASSPQKNRSGQRALWSHATTAPPPARKIYGPKRGSQTANILDGVILVDHRVHGVIAVVDRQNLLAIESYLDKRLVSLWKPESVDLLVLPHEVSSFYPE